MKLIVLTVLTALIGSGFLQSNFRSHEANYSNQDSILKITYSRNIQSVMIKKCSPCHFPPEGNGEYLDTYSVVKDAAVDIIERIKMKEDEEGFMPRKHTRLSDSTINLFVQWQKDGLLQ